MVSLEESLVVILLARHRLPGQHSLHAGNQPGRSAENFGGARFFLIAWVRDKPYLLPIMKSVHQSETSKHRARLAPYCEGYGIDIGYGGDPITPDAIRMDLKYPYGATGNLGVQLGGDCKNLVWFKDETLDYAYSSHVLEDFDVTQTEHVMREWARILKVGGRLVLLQPDQPRYIAYCRKHNEPPNAHHSIDHFSLKYVIEVANRIGNLEVVASEDHLDEYSFFVVFAKTKPDRPEASPEELEHLRRELARVHADLEQAAARLDRYQNNPLVRVLRKIKNLGK